MMRKRRKFFKKYFSLVLGSGIQEESEAELCTFSKSKSRYQYSTTLWRREWFAKSEMLALRNI
jgi:hypothetical protein